MVVEQLYTGCLAEAAYYIESEGEVAIIDPLRESSPYIKKAERNQAKIKYIFETHFHADFVSGHLDLSQKTGAKIIFGPTAQPKYEARIANDGEIFELGKVKIKTLHTPGHTPESTTFLLIDENGKEHCIFTGDTLFIGDVGRPDLALKGNLTEQDLASLLYDSLHTKILPLPDDIIVYPGHGAGSACGKSMSKETWQTLGNQKQNNYALKAKSKEQFVKEVTEGLVKPPQYFPKNALLNKVGYESFDAILERGKRNLSPEEFEALANETGAILLDVRSPQEFVKGFIPNSISIGIDGQFAPWVGALITDLQQPILLIAPQGREEETIMRLSRVGYDKTLGFLDGGFESWKNSGKQTDTVESIDVNEFAKRFDNQTLKVLDVRKQSEFEAEHIKQVPNFPLDFINENMHKLNRNQTYYLHCAGGYRSVIASSILKARGFDNLVNIEGGFKAIKDSEKFEVTDFVCPSTML